jgi:hypothetical protein
MARKVHIEYLPIDQLLKSPQNPKEHDIGGIHESVKRFGYVTPIVIDEATGYIIEGHGRLETLQQKKHAGNPPPTGIHEKKGSWLVPVVRGISFDGEHDAQAYLIAANRLTELGGWHDARLAEVLQDLCAHESLAGIGYDADDLDVLMKRLAGPQETSRSGDGGSGEPKITCPECGHEFKL